MSSNISIKVENLSKVYHIYKTPRDRLLQSFLRGRKQLYSEHWAMDDVSFEIKRGETVGIVGCNGAGKSTLLKMICGTLTPTSGKIIIDGRVTALIELGTGFNPAFTGRENAILSATILGIPDNEIDSFMEKVEEFADIGEFIDQPVNTYSSGMAVRLGFAVAVNGDPDIFIVDEALAVGDEAFTRKCYAKMRAIQESGTTLLFVTHSSATVIEFCDRAILLEGGKLVYLGSPKKVIDRYHKLIFMPSEKRKQYASELLKETELALDRKTAPESKDTTLGGKSLQQQHDSRYYDPHMTPKSTEWYHDLGASIINPSLMNAEGSVVNILKRREAYIFSYTVNVARDLENIFFTMLIKSINGTELGGSISSSINKNKNSLKKGSTVDVEFRFSCNLNHGTYFLNAGVVDSAGNYLHRGIDVAMFKVIEEKDSTVTAAVDFLIEPEIKII